MPGTKKRDFEIEQIGSGPSAAYRLHYLQDGKKIGHEDFHGDGTKDGDIEAQQQAQDKAGAWIESGEK